MSSPFDSKYDAIRARVIYYADYYGIDRNIAIWQIWQESRFNPNASSGEANGLCQFTPATAARFGVNVWDIESSLNGWGKYMVFLLNRFNQNYQFALAGYNAGEGNVDKYGGIPPFTETKNYVATITANAGTESGNVNADPGAAPTTEISTGLLIAGAVLLYLLVD